MEGRASQAAVQRARRQAPWLHLPLARSPVLAIALLLGHGLAVAVVGIAVASVWLAVPLAVAVAGVAGVAVRRDAWRAAPDSIVAVDLPGDGRWRLVRRDGRVVETRCDARAWATRQGVVVPLRPVDGGPRGLCLTADAVGTTGLRQLRARLAWGPERPGAADAPDDARDA